MLKSTETVKLINFFINFYAILILATISGWFLNISRLIFVFSEPIVTVTVFTVLQIIGVFLFPLGGLLGWIGLFI